MMRRAPLSAAVVALALLASGCGGGGGTTTSTGQSASKQSSGGSSTTGKANQQRTSDNGSAEQRSSAYNQNLLPFGTDPLSDEQITALIENGEIPLPVRVRKAGVLSAFGQAQPELSIIKVARAAPVTASGPGIFTLRLRLTPQARKILNNGDSLLMYLAIKFSRSRTMQQLTVPLKP